ncbi:MAG: hypothetical protein ACRDG4_21045 [Chloroflexota bacterium]
MAQGLEQGVELGAVQARQEDILRILHRRYSTVPELVSAQIRRIVDPVRLSAVLDSAADARSLAEFTEALEG